MIAALPIAAGLLAVLSDDESPDFDELFQRAVAFENPKVLYDAMTLEQVGAFLVWLHSKCDTGGTWSRTEEEDRSYQVFRLFFDAAPLYTVIRATGHAGFSCAVFEGDKPENVSADNYITRNDAICILRAGIHERKFALDSFSDDDLNEEEDSRIMFELFENTSKKPSFSRMNSLVVTLISDDEGGMMSAVFDAIRYDISLINVGRDLWAVLKALDGQDVRPAWAKL